MLNGPKARKAPRHLPFQFFASAPHSGSERGEKGKQQKDKREKENDQKNGKDRIHKRIKELKVH